MTNKYVLFEIGDIAQLIEQCDTKAYYSFPGGKNWAEWKGKANILRELLKKRKSLDDVLRNIREIQI
jgi:hypothetical protein